MNNFPASKLVQQFGKRSIYYLLLTLILLGGCEDEASFLGVDLIPDGDKTNLQYFTTTDIQSYTSKQERLPVSSPVFLSIGEYQDSLFGHSKASFNAQIFPSLMNTNFGENPNADSMVFRFVLASTFGDSVNIPEFQVFELTDSISSSMTSAEGYYDPFNPIFTGKPYLTTDSITSSGNTIAVKTLNLNIGTSLASQLINADTVVYDSINYFLDFFNGLHFEPVPQDNNQSILSLNFDDTKTLINLYYNNLSNDSLSAAFDFLKGGVRNQFFEHEYSGTPFAENFGNKELKDSLLYVQAMNGTEAVIIPEDFERWRDSVPLAITKAELVVYIDEPLSNSVEKPSSMVLLQSDTSGLYSIIDMLSGQSVFGGFLDDENMSYTFNLTRFVQNYVNGRTDNFSFILQPSSNQSVPRRVVLKSAQSQNKKIILKIMYTKL